MNKIGKVAKWILGIILGYVVCELIAQPVLGIITNCSNGLFRAISDYFFRSCAHARIEVMILYIVIILGVMNYFPVVKDVISGIRDTRKEYKIYVELEEKLNSIGTDSLKQEVIKYDNHKNKQNEEKDLLGEIKEEKRVAKRFYWLFIICIMLIVAWVLMFVLFYIIPSVYRLSFDEAVTKITPYVEQCDIDILKSDWVTMENHEDFNKIEAFIDDVIEKNNLKK